MASPAAAYLSCPLNRRICTCPHFFVPAGTLNQLANDVLLIGPRQLQALIKNLGIASLIVFARIQFNTDVPHLAFFKFTEAVLRAVDVSAFGRCE